jgi:hypothetical protein
LRIEEQTLTLSLRAPRRMSSRAKRIPEGCMGELIPVGYLTKHEAIDVIARSLFAGTPALTQEVNRYVNSDKPISEETVTRALDHLYEATGDRQFQRIHRRAA